MGTEILYGANPVLEVLRAGKRRCHCIFTAHGKREIGIQQIIDEATRLSLPLKKLSRDEISKFARTDKHQGIAVRCDSFPYSSLEEVLGRAAADERKGFIVLLDGITDPQNLGSIARTAYLMGVHGVILARDNVAPVSSTVVKASAGATEYIMIAQVTNLAETLKYLKERGYWISGADGDSQDILYLHDFKAYNTALVLGSEGRGMRRLVKERCDYLLSIPMEGSIKSYNVSIAGALFMGEVARQRGMLFLSKTMSQST